MARLLRGLTHTPPVIHTLSPRNVKFIKRTFLTRILHFFRGQEGPAHSSKSIVVKEAAAENLRTAMLFLSESKSLPNKQKLIELSAKHLSELNVEELELLGKAFFEGVGLPQDPKRAVEVWREGASRGSPECQYSLAGCLRSGQGMDEVNDHEECTDNSMNRLREAFKILKEVR